MSDERDDDVPIYFSPGDDNIEIDEFDRKALLEDQPAQEWDRYKPAKTLEQAAEEARKAGEVKIRGMRNRRSSEEQGAASNTDRKTRSQSITMTRLKMITEHSGSDSIPRVSYSGPMPVDDGDEGSGVHSVPHSSSVASGAGGRSAHIAPVAETGLSNAWKLILGLLALNIFAVGIWCGSFLFPSSSHVSSLYDDEPKPATPAGSKEKARKIRLLKGDTTIADIVERLNPVVVNIDTRYAHEGTRPHGPGQNQASGLVIQSDGYILTNNHVIPANTQIRVTLDDRREFEGKVIGRDSYTDLAVIKIDANYLQTARLGSVDDLRPGDWAIAIGSPYGYDHSVSVGVVSALDRRVDYDHHVAFLQTDAAINPGNSGGPLVNIDGEVIGICTSAVLSGTRGIGFAIPVDLANSVSRKLMSEGSIVRPYLGLYMRDIDPERKKASSLPGKPIAVAANKVVAGGPAADAGFQPGDLITRVNGTPVHSSDEVRAFIHAAKPGDTLDMDIVRHGVTSRLKVKLGNYPSNI